jgi:hypothetical protein
MTSGMSRDGATRVPSKVASKTTAHRQRGVTLTITTR